MKLVKIAFNWIRNIFTANPFDEDQIQHILYLYQSEALPLALKEEEERALISKLDESDDVAKQKLIEHNLRLVVYIAKKFENTDCELEDLISVGSIGLIKAINSYKSDKNIKIATYASKCIENEILMHLRKISKQKREVLLSDTLNIDGDGNELTVFDVMPNNDESPEEDILMTEEKKVLWRILNSLNRRERKIMIMRFGLDGKDELTQKEVAEMLGISQSYISRLEKKIVVRIKKEMVKIL